MSVNAFREKCRELAIRDRHHEVLELMQEVPHEVIESDEDLAFWYALCLLSTVRYVEGKKAADAFIHRYVTPDNSLGIGREHLLRSHLNIMEGNTGASYDHELKAVSYLPQHAYHERLRAWATIDTMAGHLGDTARMEQAVEELADVRNNLPFDQSWWYSFVAPNRADILAKRGYLTKAETLLLAQLPTVPYDEQAKILKLRLAVIALEQQKPAEASTWLEDVGLDDPEAYWTTEAFLITARVEQLLGNSARAIQILQTGMAEKAKAQIRANLHRFQMQMCDLWIREGEIELAEAWIGLTSKSLDPWPRTFGHPIPNPILAALEMAKGDGHEAIRLLETLRDEGERRNHKGLLVSVYSHLAYAYHSLNDHEAARDLVQLAVQSGKHGDFHDSYIVLGVDVRTMQLRSPHMPTENRGHQHTELTVLSYREQEVLNLVAAGMRNTEIAENLFLSVNTVKNHLANIFRRLGVSTRHAAVQVARQQGLLHNGQPTRS